MQPKSTKIIENKELKILSQITKTYEHLLVSFSNLTKYFEFLVFYDYDFSNFYSNVWVNITVYSAVLKVYSFKLNGFVSNAFQSLIKWRLYYNPVL